LKRNWYRNLEVKTILTAENKHTKHNKIERRVSGTYGATEIVFVGAPCGKIQDLSRSIIQAVSKNYEVSYVDADHGSFENPQKADFLEQGASMFLSDKQSSVRITKSPLLNSIDAKLAFNECDLALVNGNHFQGEFQIVMLDSGKLKSLEKRVDQLTNVIAVIKVDDIAMPDFLIDALPTIEDLPIISYTDTNRIVELVSNKLAERKPKLNALILAGGKSTRMGEDKATLTYDNQRQVDRLLALLQSKVADVYVSCRREQNLDVKASKIYDRMENMGPLGAITTAFRENPNAAWLVVACDLPMLDSAVLDQLIASRSQKHTATAFLNHETGFAEPLITIWEPKSYMRMLQFEALGFTCPRKVLINSNTLLLKPENPEKLFNVNTPKDFEVATKALEQ